MMEYRRTQNMERKSSNLLSRDTNISLIGRFYRQNFEGQAQLVSPTGKLFSFYPVG